jgi:transcription elongation factor SPT5
MDAQEIARELRERYRNSNREYDGSANFSDRKANMPTSQDPKLWQVRCKAGQERTVITTICLKGFAAADRGEDFGIFSAFERDSLPGTIFVEAYGRDHVARALQGVSNVYLQAARSGGEEQKNTITLIENRDMVPLLTMKKKEVTPKRNMWVRIKRGKYTGDLAQIVEIMGDGQTVAVLLVPRIDYNPERSQQERKRKQGKANTLASRPTQSLFRPNTIAEVYGRGAFREEAGRYLFQGEEFTQAGLLDKEYPVASILTENINPTLNEIAKFQGDNADHGETLSKFNLDAIAEAAKKTAGSNIRPGDQIEAAEGELAGLKGVVETVTGEVVLVRFPSRELHGNHEDQLIELPAKSVRKIFRVGDHVKVMQGVNVNDTGMVLSVDQNVVTFFSDLSQKEVKAFSRDLREAATIGALNNRVGNFELHDLVTIDAQTVGVIFQTERDGFKVVDQNGSIRSVRPHQITKQPIQISRRTVGMDHKDREFRMGDQMKEVEGEYRKGLVLHVYRGLFTFLHSRDIVENSGVFVVRSKNLGPVDERVTTKSGPDLKKQDPSLNQAAPIITGPQAANRRHLINTHVVIVKGTKKGLQGIIKDTQGDNARVELKTDNKVVTVPIASLKKKE